MDFNFFWKFLALVYFANFCIDFETRCTNFPSKSRAFPPFLPSEHLARRVLCKKVEGLSMRTDDLRGEFLKLVSTVIGLSVGVGVMTATVLLGAAALLQ